MSPAAAVLLVAAAALVLILVQGEGTVGSPEDPDLPVAGPGAGPAPAPAAEGPAPRMQEEPVHLRNLPPDSPYHRVDKPVDSLVRGVVTAADWIEFPLGGQVVLEPQGAPSEGGARSAGIGPDHRSFRFEGVPFGQWRIRLLAPGFEELSVLLTTSASDPDQHLVLPLNPASRLRGRALDEVNRPLADLIVTATLLSDDPSVVALPKTVRTGADGAFEFSGLEPGLYRVHAGPPHNPLGVAKEIQFLGKEGWVELVLSELSEAEVVVTDQDTGEPVAGLRVVAQGQNKGHTASATTGADGVARLPYLPPDDYAFTVFGSGYPRVVRRSATFAGRTTEVPVKVLADKPERG